MDQSEQPITHEWQATMRKSWIRPRSRVLNVNEWAFADGLVIT